MPRRRAGRKPGTGADALRHARLSKDLLAELTRLRPAPHAPFLSEAIIRKKYGVSLQTVRRALLSLEREGYLYRIPSKGTFVAPPRKHKRLLLFIPNMRPTDRDWIRGSGGEIAFFLNAIDRASQADIPFELVFESGREGLLRRVGEGPAQAADFDAVAVFRDFTVLDAVEPILLKRGIPLLFYGSSTQRSRVAAHRSLLYDETRVTRLALDHLWALGHRRIGCIWVPTHHAQAARHEAWLAWLSEKGLPFEPELDLPVAYASVADTTAFRDMELRRQGKAWTALFTADDQFLPQVLRVLRSRGRAIPAELSVVGVNNSPGSSWSDPPCTVVDLPLHVDGRRLVELAARALKGEPGHWESDVTLIVRESTAAAPSL